MKLLEACRCHECAPPVTVFILPDGSVYRPYVEVPPSNYLAELWKEISDRDLERMARWLARPLYSNDESVIVACDAETGEEVFRFRARVDRMGWSHARITGWTK